MLCAVLTGPGRLEIRETGDPSPGPGEVVLRVRSSLTCKKDLQRWREGTPGALGREYSGEVAAVGEGVRGVREGDPVMTVPAVPCGACPSCARGLEALCERLDDDPALGGFAQLVRIPAPVVLRGMFPKPPALSYTDAAFLEPLARVGHALSEVAIEDDDTVVILGAGPIGLLFLSTLKQGGARRVMVAGRGAERLALARELGADEVVDCGARPLAEAVREATGGHGAEVLVECTGAPEMWKAAFDAASRGSEVILFGGCPVGDSVEYDTTRLHYDQISLRGACHFNSRSLRLAYELLKAGAVRPGLLVSGRASLRDLGDVFHRLDRGNGLKYEILPEDS